MNLLLDHDVPDDMAHLLTHLGHQVKHLRDVLPRDASDAQVLNHATQLGWIVMTCNRDDFLALARERTHCGVIILIRRRSRVAERAALLRLIEKAGTSGLANNINFA